MLRPQKTLIKITFFMLGIALSALQLSAATPVNSLTIREKAGVTTLNYPIQIGRPFMPGEVLNFPKAVIDGTAVTTQADVKSRWPDNSVKHAVLTFYIPKLTANSLLTVTFTNQSTGNNTGALTKAQMLSNTYNFDAGIELTQGTTKVSASAETMLNAGKYTNWNGGAVSTSIMIADHSAARAYDIGLDANKSFRPIFHATFWPTIKKVKIRVIGEIANTETLQDQLYSLTIKLGNKQTKTVYTKANIKHIAGSRWTKEFWLGDAPPAIEINHNLSYLKETKFLPYYDTSRVISTAAITDAYNQWLATPKDLFDNGSLTKYMPTTGGRDEIGPYPTWTVRWLYTGDTRAQQQTFGNADLSAAFPVHFREGDSTKKFDRAQSISALGKVLSIEARPTIILNSGNQYINFTYTAPEDKITPVGTMSDNGWIPDSPHQPDYHSALYTLTGDYWYLEELYFWAAWSAADPSYSDQYYGRGPTGNIGGIYGEIRGDAWILRTRAQTAFLAPDGSAEKAYFTTLTNDAIAIWEGVRNITGSTFQGTPNWNWGNSIGLQRYGNHGIPTVPSLRFWEEGFNVPPYSADADPANTALATLPWQHHYLLYSLGRAKELGFQTGPLLSWLGQLFIAELADPAYNPYLAISYRMPTVKLADYQYVPTWFDERNGFLSSYNPQADFPSQILDANNGYPMYLIAAGSMLKNEPNGNLAWGFIQQNILVSPAINDNPRWAILPRP